MARYREFAEARIAATLTAARLQKPVDVRHTEWGWEVNPDTSTIDERVTYTGWIRGDDFSLSILDLDFPTPETYSVGEDTEFFPMDDERDPPDWAAGRDDAYDDLTPDQLEWELQHR